jgi:hypothetical protein
LNTTTYIKKYENYERLNEISHEERKRIEGETYFKNLDTGNEAETSGNVERSGKTSIGSNEEQRLAEAEGYLLVRGNIKQTENVSDVSLQSTDNIYGNPDDIDEGQPAGLSS